MDESLRTRVDLSTAKASLKSQILEAEEAYITTQWWIATRYMEKMKRRRSIPILK
jgi:hypothetical protein